MSTTTSAELSLIKANAALDAMATAIDTPSMLVRRDQSLLVVDESGLTTPDGPAASINLDASDCAVLARSITGRFHLDPESGRVAWIVGSRVYRAALGDGGPQESVALPSLPGPVVKAVPAGDGRPMLLLWSDACDVGPYGEFAAVFDPGLNSVRTVSVIRSTAPLSAHWSAPMRSWLVFDSIGECLWRLPLSVLDSPAPLIDAREAGGRIQAVSVHPSGRWVALLLGETGDRPASLRIGDVDETRIRWQPTVSLPPGLIRLMRWHPTERLLVLDRGIRRKGDLMVVNARGSVIQQCPLPAGWFSNDLTFSSDGHHVFAAGARAIGVWTLQSTARTRK